MYYYRKGIIVHIYKISTANNDLNGRKDSCGTPPGMHRVKEKFGHKQPVGMVFKARQPAGWFYWNIAPSKRSEDLVTTRILWLDGLEKGVNKNGFVDSYNRYIYIHGTNHEDKTGTVESHGCIRMLNDYIIVLYDNIKCGALVLIEG